MSVALHCVAIIFKFVFIFMRCRWKTRNSAIADKPWDASVQYATSWLIPPPPKKNAPPHVLTRRIWSFYSNKSGNAKNGERWGTAPWELGHTRPSPLGLQLTTRNVIAIRCWSNCNTAVTTTIRHALDSYQRSLSAQSR